MIIVLKQEAKNEDVTRIEKTIEEKGLQVHVSKGENQTIMGLIGDTTKVDPESIEVDPAVEKVMHVSEPYKLANRAFHPEDSVIDVDGVKIGGGHLAVIAGPCSVESKEQVIEIAKAAKAAGANLLRGGAFKPRTSPYAFQGMGSAGLDILVAAKEATGLPIVSELMDAEYLDEFIEKSKGKLSSVVILDGVEDSHNLGAIIRTCVCAGVDGIIIPSRRNVQVNSIVEKTSAGAVNHIPIIKVNSLVNAVQRLKDNDWWVIATDASAKDNYYDVKYNDMNFAIIMGAEHAGVSKSLLKASDFVVKIPMQNSFNSLNVSNALSAIIFETLRQKLTNK